MMSSSIFGKYKYKMNKANVKVDGLYSGICVNMIKTPKCC